MQSYLAQVTNVVRNPATLGSHAAKTAEKSAETVINSPQSFLARVRDLDAATLTTVGVVTAETIGFFSIGEMLGRFKIVGYRSSGSHGDHH